MKDAYRELCRQEPTIPLFSRDWWLDATAGENNWDVAIVEANGQIQATLPYTIRRRLGFTILSQPSLTQALGPWTRSSNAGYAKTLARQKDLMHALIDQLPAYDHYVQSWNFAQANWLPFFWRGFQQTTRYTYRLPKLNDLDEIWAGFQPKARTDIRKATDRMGLRVNDEATLEPFLDLNRKVFERQGLSMPYEREMVRRLDQEALRMGARKIFMAIDASGTPHAAVYIVWDQSTTFYLMAGSDPHLRDSGAASLCMWEAIKFASTVSQSFDFEGSMLEPVERFIRGFGAVQTPYSRVTRTPSHLLSLAIWLKSRRQH